MPPFGVACWCPLSSWLSRLEDANRTFLQTTRQKKLEQIRKAETGKHRNKSETLWKIMESPQSLKNLKKRKDHKRFHNLGDLRGGVLEVQTESHKYTENGCLALGLYGWAFMARRSSQLQGGASVLSTASCEGAKKRVVL